jgi:hypothetical protein
VKLTPHSVTVAEVRVKSNAIHIENIDTKPRARTLNLDNLPRQQEMITITLREILDLGLFLAGDAIGQSKGLKTTGQC